MKWFILSLFFAEGVLATSLALDDISGFAKLYTADSIDALFNKYTVAQLSPNGKKVMPKNGLVGFTAFDGRSYFSLRNDGSLDLQNINGVNLLLNPLGFLSKGNRSYTFDATGTGIARIQDLPIVHPWAKATTKPTYIWDEVIDKPDIATLEDLGYKLDINQPIIIEDNFGFSAELDVGKLEYYDSDANIRTRFEGTELIYRKGNAPETHYSLTPKTPDTIARMRDVTYSINRVEYRLSWDGTLNTLVLKDSILRPKITEFYNMSKASSEAIATSGNLISLYGNHLKFDKSIADEGVFFNSNFETYQLRISQYMTVMEDEVLFYAPDLVTGEYTIILRTRGTNANLLTPYETSISVTLL